MALATSALVAPDAGVATLELRKLDKRFAGTHALKAVSLSFMPGEVHAIV
jgi:ribose transport system ATP-binding protein